MDCWLSNARWKRERYLNCNPKPSLPAFFVPESLSTFHEWRFLGLTILSRSLMILDASETKVFPSWAVFASELMVNKNSPHNSQRTPRITTSTLAHTSRRSLWSSAAAPLILSGGSFDPQRRLLWSSLSAALILSVGSFDPQRRLLWSSASAPLILGVAGFYPTALIWRSAAVISPVEAVVTSRSSRTDNTWPNWPNSRDQTGAVNRTLPTPFLWRSGGERVPVRSRLAALGQAATSRCHGSDVTMALTSRWSDSSRDVIFRKMTNRNQTDTNEMATTEIKYQIDFILPKKYQ